MGFESGFIIPDGGITEVKLANSSVTTNKISNTAVTLAKLSSTLQVQFDKITFLQPAGGTGADGALNVTSGTTDISGLKNYTSVSVSAGATLNITDNTAIRCQGNFSNEGNITSSDNTSAGTFGEQGGNATADSAVGIGGHGSMKGFRYLLGCVLGSGAKGGAGAVHRGGGGGGNYQKGSDGSAGSGGAGTSNGSGGNGKFGLYLEVLGNLTNASGATLNLNGNGGGSATGDGGAGGGGGAGSCIAVVYNDFTNAGSMTCNGGSGGSAVTGGNGGSGSGGMLKVYYGGSISNTGTFTATNGLAETEAILIQNP